MVAFLQLFYTILIGMQKINTFFHVFAHSLLPTPKYYAKILKTRIVFSLKYFLVLIFLVNFFSILFFLVKNSDLIKIGSYYKKMAMQTLDEYPADLTIRVENGHLMTNYDRPYFMWVKDKGIPHLLLVVDQRATFEKVNQYDALFLLTGEGIASRHDAYETRYYRFRPTDNFVIDKTTITGFKNQINKIYSLLPIIIALGIVALMIIVPVFAILITLTHLLILSLAVFLVSKFFLKGTKFKRVFQISLHSSTIPLIMEYSFFAFGLPITIPFGFSLIYLLFLTLSLYEVHTSKIIRK